MELDFAFLADGAEAINGKIYTVGGALDTIWSANLPMVYPRLSFVLKLLFSPAEVGRKHRLEVNLIDEDGKRLGGGIGADLEISKGPNVPRGWKQGFLTVINFANLKFEKFGDYSFEILVNNSSIKMIPLRIAQRVQLQS